MPSHPLKPALTTLAATLLLLASAALHAQSPDDIDFARAKQLHQRALKGEKLSDAERAYIERARAEFRKRQTGKPGARPRLEPRDSTGLIPLSNPAPHNNGGLYGLGRTQPPHDHLQAALDAALAIQALDAQGQPAPTGKIALISLGMSNTTQEFQRFLALFRADPDRSPAAVAVDGAQGGMDAAAWANPQRLTRAGRPNPWTVLDQRLSRAAVSPLQVQAVWIKQARANPAALGDYPRHADALKNDLVDILHTLKQKFPNLRIAYLSSRIYAGYASSPLNPEPYAYESALAVRSLILEQINGKPSLNFDPDPDRGKVEAPVLLWGPYLWADGTTGRASDDLVWLRADLASDGTHPSPSGQKKVADLLLKFLKTDPTARPWFLKAQDSPDAPQP